MNGEIGVNMRELGANAMYTGSGRPEIKPMKRPEHKVPFPTVETNLPPTPEAIANEVMRLTTGEQLAKLSGEHWENYKRYLKKLGKAAVGVAIPEAVTLVKGARELKYKNMSKDDKGTTTSREKVTLDKNNTVQFVDQHIVNPDQVIDIHTKVDQRADGGQDLHRKITETPLEDAPKDGTSKKFSFGAAYKAGRNYEFKAEQKSKKEEKVIEAAAMLMKQQLRPYPDVPFVVPIAADAIGTFFPETGIRFLPAVYEALAASFDMGKSTIKITKQMREVIRKSPEAVGTKGDIQALAKVVEHLVAEKINKMKSPTASAAVAAFA